MTNADLQDAGTIRAMFAVLETSRRPRSSQANAIRRWILNGIWGIASRDCYVGAVWSVAARAHPDRKQIVYEHVVPIGVIRDELLSGPQTDEAYLDTLSRLFVMAVVTKAEDRLLSAAGFKNKHPQSVVTDVWARYQAVGLEMDTTSNPAWSDE